MNWKKPSYFFVSLALITAPACLGLRNRKQSFDINKITLDENTIPALVIGGGAAGLTAAVYFSQANIPCTVIEGPKPGGALAQSHSVRNWPGVIDARGNEIVSSIKKQALSAGAKILSHSVTNVNLKSWPYLVTTTDLLSGKKHIFKALTLLITLGAEPNYLEVPGEQQYWGKGVSNCAVCDGSLFKDKNVAVIGGGDAAIEEADYLSGIAGSVTLFVRRDVFRAKDVAAKQRVFKKKNVSVVTNTQVKEIIGDGKQVTAIKTIHSKTKQERTREIDGVFLAIGSQPNTTLFQDQLDLDDKGFISLPNHQETSKPGVYAAGDVCDQVFVQAITASGDACKAALQATTFLKHAHFDAKKFIAKKQATTKRKQIKGVINITTQQAFDDFIVASTGPVVVDLFAQWCGPCKRMAPIFENLAREFEGKVTFAKIDIQRAQLNLDSQLRRIGASSIQSIPAFLFINKGKTVNEVIGARSINDMRRMIRSQFGV